MPRRKGTKEHGLNPNRDQLDAIVQKSYELIKQRIRLAMRGEAHPSLQTSDIFHELYLKLIEDVDLSFEDTRKVINLISIKTRLYIIDRARKRKADKRGGGMLVPLSLAKDVSDTPPMDILLLHEALEKLAQESPLAAEIVQLRWFFGLTQKEISEIVNHDRSVIQKYWEFSKVWITDILSQQPCVKQEMSNGR